MNNFWHLKLYILLKLNEEAHLETAADLSTSEKKEYLTGLARENYQKFQKMLQRYLSTKSSNQLNLVKNETQMESTKITQYNFFLRFIIKMIGKFKNQIKLFTKNLSQFEEKSFVANEDQRGEEDEEFNSFLKMIQRYNNNFDKFKIVINDKGSELIELIERHERFNQHWNKELIRLKELYNFSS